MAYSVYLDDVLLPITPSKITTKIKNQNKTLALINEAEINLLKSPGLSGINFAISVPHTAYPFAVYPDGFRDISFFLGKLETLKTKQKPFHFKVIREKPQGMPMYNTEILVSVEDYDIVEDAKDGFDITINVQLKQYKHYSTKVVTIMKESPAEVEVEVEEERETESAPNAETHTVVSGDNLWSLAKKYLGDGSKYMEIFNLNKDKITNPNQIQIGQVLVLPKRD